jgi:hypothetical protein
MKQFLMTMAGVFVGLVLFLVGVPFLLIVMAASAARPAPIPTHTVLQLDLRGGLSDQDPQNPFAALGGGGQSVMSIIETLRRAETDDKVEAVLVRLPEGGMAPASADELRLAFKHFRAVGKKPIFAHSQGLYPSGLVTSTYMLGAAASEFWTFIRARPPNVAGSRWVQASCISRGPCLTTIISPRSDGLRTSALPPRLQCASIISRTSEPGSSIENQTTWPEQRRRISRTRGSSAFRIAIPPSLAGGSASTSSPLAWAVPSLLPNSPRCAEPMLRTMPIWGGAMVVR